MLAPAIPYKYPLAAFTFPSITLPLPLARPIFASPLASFTFPSVTLPLPLPLPLVEFAASAALTLNYCLARHRNGLPTTGEVFSPQDLISCASREINPRTGSAYGGGVDGASNSAVAAYILDHGITTTGCFPYAQTGRCLAAHPCRTSCVPESTVAAMKKVKGRGVQDGSRMQAMRFKTEANVAAAMQRCVAGRVRHVANEPLVVHPAPHPVPRPRASPRSLARSAGTARLRAATMCSTPSSSC